MEWFYREKGENLIPTRNMLTPGQVKSFLILPGLPLALEKPFEDLQFF